MDRVRLRHELEHPRRRLRDRVRIARARHRVAAVVDPRARVGRVIPAVDDRRGLEPLPLERHRVERPGVVDRAVDAQVPVVRLRRHAAREQELRHQARDGARVDVDVLRRVHQQRAAAIADQQRRDDHRRHVTDQEERRQRQARVHHQAARHAQVDRLHPAPAAVMLANTGDPAVNGVACMSFSSQLVLPTIGALKLPYKSQVEEVDVELRRRLLAVGRVVGAAVLHALEVQRGDVHRRRGQHRVVPHLRAGVRRVVRERVARRLGVGQPRIETHGLQLDVVARFAIAMRRSPPLNTLISLFGVQRAHRCTACSSCAPLLLILMSFAQAPKPSRRSSWCCRGQAVVGDLEVAGRGKFAVDVERPDHRDIDVAGTEIRAEADDVHRP